MGIVLFGNSKQRAGVQQPGHRTLNRGDAPKFSAKFPVCVQEPYVPPISGLLLAKSPTVLSACHKAQCEEEHKHSIAGTSAAIHMMSSSTVDLMSSNTTLRPSQAFIEQTMKQGQTAPATPGCTTDDPGIETCAVMSSTSMYQDGMISAGCP